MINWLELQAHQFQPRLNYHNNNYTINSLIYGQSKLKSVRWSSQEYSISTAFSGKVKALFMNHAITQWISHWLNRQIAVSFVFNINKIVWGTRNIHILFFVRHDYANEAE